MKHFDEVLTHRESNTLVYRGTAHPQQNIPNKRTKKFTRLIYRGMAYHRQL